MSKHPSIRFNLLCPFLLGLVVISCSNHPATPDSPIYSSRQREFIVPYGNGRPVMTDGIFQPAEWDDAATLVINDTVNLYFKQFSGHFFFALDSRQLLSPSIDLYISADKQNILQLHVSAQLGERMLRATPNEPLDTAWVWGRTSGWYANEFRWIYKLLDSLVNIDGLDYETAINQAGFHHEGIEIDVLKSKIKGSIWRLRIEIWTARGKGEQLVFSQETERLSTTNWAEIRFE
ncbi:MAG: hypothetical protein GWN00_24285 [Aliifodinibius sp.]|nr:hypothetical protein [candidate division Zixibacteria bacterium]NIT59224.1 hypothetical protein [Fodinibius sp.]NIW40485.1 hypothetical protein [candidate division Zixibacteria bacterium]NIX57808.1 hypothetical protein [candidate division Zixibacteria bacterium]NIY27807.1 hypothetical protein [Fodinibius sp.]